MKPLIYTVLFLCLAFQLSAQEEPSNRYERPAVAPEAPYLSNYIINEARQPLYLPEVDGYVLLRCDLHLHTVFSDGTVWPTTRVEEAFREGLDVISLTDHLEFRNINRKDVDTDNLMREYEIARKKADELGIMLIPGLEVTRKVPTGHYNLLFIDDPSPLLQYVDKENPGDPSNIEEILSAGKKLGAFITWNHPAYQAPNGAEWGPVQQSLYEKGLINGIELVNSNLYVPAVHRWADEKHITKMSNTDWHGSFRIRDGYHRAMTIVFARNRSVEAVKEALFNRQTIGYANNYLFGDQKFLEPVFLNSLKTRLLSATDKSVIVEIRNTSGIPYELSLDEDDCYVSARINNQGITVRANETLAIQMDKKHTDEKHEFHVTVRNLLVKAGEPLHAVLTF